MKIQISKFGFAILISIVVLCFYLTSCFAIFIIDPFSIRDNPPCAQDKFFNNNSLLNLEGESVFQKGYKSTDDLLKNYPWFTQYFFDSPGEPYCALKLDPFYSMHTSWIRYKAGERSNPKIINNLLEDKDISILSINSSEYMNQGYIVIKKQGDLYYSQGFFGYYSAE